MMPMPSSPGMLLLRSRGSPPGLHTKRKNVGWPSQDIRLRQRFCEQVNHPFIAPPTCNAHTVAMVLHDYCARYAPPLTLLLYAIHHSLCAMAILFKGKDVGDTSWPLQDIAITNSVWCKP